MVQYLLGELRDDEERARFEQRLLADEKLYEELLIAEDELMEAYLSGELSAGDKARFEEPFLASPRRRERVENLSALREVLTRRPSSPSGSESGPPWPRPALAVAFGAAWVYE